MSLGGRGGAGIDRLGSGVDQGTCGASGSDPLGRRPGWIIAMILMIMSSEMISEMISVLTDSNNLLMNQTKRFEEICDVFLHWSVR